MKTEMKLETMYYIALGTVINEVKASDAWAEFARTADGEAERKRALRQSLKAKAWAIVGFDREMDRLVKEYK
jgi:hypothetical protein